MATPTVVLLTLEYRQADTPIVRDVTVHVIAPSQIRIDDLTPLERQQIARHLRDVADALEGGSPVLSRRGALVITAADPSTPPLVAYKDPA